MRTPFSLPELDPQIPRLGNAFSQWLGCTVLRAFGWRFVGDFPKQGKLVIVVAPHTSNWDFFLALSAVFALRLRITYFAKDSLFNGPWGRLLKRWGGVPIERSSRHGVVEQMASQLIRAEKMLVCLAPEGTRSYVPEWKSGFLHIAQQAEVPVFLFGMDYQQKCFRLGPVIEVAQDTQQSMQQVYDFYRQVPAKYPSLTSVGQIKNG